MTLPLNSRLSALYDTNGTQKDFSFGFRVFFDPDNGGYGLEVRRQTADGYEVIPKSDYLVLPVEDNSAGVVRFSVAPAAGQQIYIAGKTPTIQQLVLTNFGRYSAESIETQFDFITAIIQEWLSALGEETRQRIAADDILTQYVVQRIDAFVQQVNQNWDDKSQEIEDYIATIMPSFTQTLRDEIEAYAVAGMKDAINQTLAESKAEIDDAVARANAAALAAAITGKVYDTPEAGVNPVTGVQNGAYYNVRSPDDDSYLVEYQNVGGVPTPSGKSYPSSAVVQQVADEVVKHNKAFPSVLDHANVVGDGVVGDSVALQEYFRDADDNRKSSIFFPLRNYNYLIDAPLIVQEPLMIYGDAGATYNRGIGKDGKIIIGGTHAFDLGNYRTWSGTQNIDTKNSKNPADNWTLKNLAFIQKPSDPVRTKTAILHTAKTNGPDRGLIMREVSATGLKHVLRTVDNGVQTQIATVVVENCVISNNELPLKFDGMCYGLRFVGNQCEQNVLGAIKGRVDAHVTIEDNMLEGQRDVIDLEIPTTGNRPKISFKRNYLESNNGDFIFRAKTNTPDSEVEIGGNFYWHHQAKHYVYLQGPSWLVKNTDPFPVSLGPNTFIKYGSEIINTNIDYFKQDGFNVFGFGSCVITSEFINILERDDYIQAVPFADTVPSYDTPIGNIRAIVGNYEYINIPLSVSAGDAYTVTLLMSADRDLSASNIQVWNPGISAIVNEVGLSPGGDFMGRLGLINLTFKASAAASSLRVRLFNSTASSGKRKLFGACAKNHGAFVDGSLLNIHVAMPDLVRTYPSQNLNYSVTASPTLNLTANTDITTTVNDARFKVGDSIIVSITQTPHYITRASASVRTDGVATVVLTPNTTSSGAVIGLKLKVVVN